MALWAGKKQIHHGTIGIVGTIGTMLENYFKTRFSQH